MAYSIKRWLDTSATAAQYVTLRDDDFDDPSIIKRVYSVIITYKSDTQHAMNAMLNYVLDGGTSFVTTYIPATNVPTATVWDQTKITFSTILSCQSIRLKIIHTTGILQINDVSVEYRPIYKRVS